MIITIKENKRSMIVLSSENINLSYYTYVLLYLLYLLY